MNYYLNFKNNQYYLIKEQNKRRKSTNNQELINQKTIELLDSSICCIIHGKRMTIKCSNGKLIIDDIHKLLNFERALQNKRNNTLFEQIRSCTKQLPKHNIKTVNAKKIAAVLLAGTIFSSFFLMNEATAIGKQNNTTSTSIYKLQTKSEKELIVFYDISLNNNNFLLEEKVEELFSSDDLTIEKRLEQANSLYNQMVENNQIIPIATQMSPYCLDRITKFLNSEGGKYVYRYAEQFGVDPYLMVAVAMKESSLLHQLTCPGEEYYNNYAIGLFQHEEPNGQIITAYNFDTNQEETEILTIESAIDLEKNIKIAAMRLQNSLTHYKGNIYLAIQGYHWGNGVTDLAICEYANRIGATYNSVIEDLTDTGWLVDFEQIRNHPNEYGLNVDKSKYTSEERKALLETIDFLINCKYSTYGNDKYIEETLSFYLGQISQSIIKDKEDIISKVTMNLLTEQKLIEPIIPLEYHK